MVTNRRIADLTPGFHVCDSPVMDQSNATTRDFFDAGGVLFSGPAMHKVINSSFEPGGTGDGVYKLVPLAYPKGTDLEAYAVRNQDGSDGLSAEANESPDREKRTVAKGVMIHVGGNYTTVSGGQRTMGSLGCFGVSSGNERMKEFVADVTKRQQLNKDNNKGNTIHLRIGKRKNAPKSWSIPIDE